MNRYLNGVEIRLGESNGSPCANSRGCGVDGPAAAGVRL
jgi:hypothetical protein